MKISKLMATVGLSAATFAVGLSLGAARNSEAIQKTQNAPSPILEQADETYPDNTLDEVSLQEALESLACIRAGIEMWEYSVVGTIAEEIPSEEQLSNRKSLVKLCEEEKAYDE
jgi:hypothetical protein